MRQNGKLTDGQSAESSISATTEFALIDVPGALDRQKKVAFSVVQSTLLGTATPAEVAAVADVSARVQSMTASGAITAGVQSVELSHATVAIAATIADAANHQGLFIAKALLEPGVGQDHTITLTAGTWNGTNTIATFADILDTLVVYFDSAGNGTIIENVGAVALS